MSAQYDITADFLIKSNYRPIHAGDDYNHSFIVYRGGLPLDLTSAKIWITIKSDPEDSDANALLQYSSANINKIEITDPTAGKFSIYLHGVDTADLSGTWPYDIKAKLGSGELFRIARGVIEFLANITRAVT